MKKQLDKILLVCLFLLPVTLSAQESTITGTVEDARHGNGLPGVTVVVKGAQHGTTTDLSGKYSIRVLPGQVLLFSYIGYQSVEIKPGSRTRIDIAMQEETTALESVVVVGYGVQKKASAVGSIVTAKGEDLLKTGGVTTVSEALQGQLPGVVAIKSTGKPGADGADIFIRGRATWGDAAPLILVDGIERGINGIDFNEIESISVLKDASATAVYGVKGANGVVLITSKRGKSQRTEVNFSANFGLKQPSSRLKWADYVTSMKMYNEAQANDRQWDKLIAESTLTAWENAYATGNYGPYNDYFPEVDWWDQTIKKVALQQTYNVNMRGGSQRMRYFASLGYLSDGDVYRTSKQEDFDPSFNYRRFNWRFNMDYDLTHTTIFSMNIAGRAAYRNEPVFQPSNGSDRYFFEPFLRTPANTFPVRYSDGHWGDSSSGQDNLTANMLTGGQNKYKAFEGFYDFSLKQDLGFITPGLSAKATLSYTSGSSGHSSIYDNAALIGGSSTNGPKQEIRYYRTYDYSKPTVLPDGSITYPLLSEKRYPDDTTIEDIPVVATYDLFDSYKRRLYYEFSLNYDASFSGHNITALALFLRRMNESTLGGDNGKMQFASYEEDWVGRITYNYKEIYLVEVNASYTGSEKFAPGKRFGFFPSFSVGWRVSEEPWMRWKPLDNLKIRYSYGKVGNDAGAARFNYIQLFDAAGNVQFGLNQDVNFGPIYTEGATGNPDATWEKATKQNLGIELGLFQKLDITLDLFDERRTDILMQRRTMASWFGGSLPSVNMGRTKNHGFELDIDWRDRIGKKFNYWARFNIASSENRMVFRDDPRELSDYLKAAGKPIGVSSALIASGNYASLDDIYNGPQTNLSTQDKLIPGDLCYIDFNGDGIIDANDKVPMGKLSYPLTTCSFSLGFKYRGVSFSAMLYAAPDVFKSNIAQLTWDFPSSNVKAQPNTLERWTPDKASASGLVRPSVHLANAHNSAASTFLYTDHSYLRLKNVEIGYDLPKQLLRKIHVSGCQVYVNANNLFTWTRADSRRDPETASSDVYPIVKRYNFGIRLSF